MKNTTKIIIAAALVLTMLFCIVSCGEKKPAEGLWATALYTENTTLGEGAKTITVEVTAEEKTVDFYIYEFPAVTAFVCARENHFISVFCDFKRFFSAKMCIAHSIRFFIIAQVASYGSLISPLKW